MGGRDKREIERERIVTFFKGIVNSLSALVGVEFFVHKYAELSIKEFEWVVGTHCE